MATHIINHPLITHKLSIMRNKDTKCKDFAENLKEITMLAAYVVTKDLTMQDIVVETPLMKMNTKKLAKDIVLVPILRAGLGFLDGMKAIIPHAKVGHIVMKRDEVTLEAKEYYTNFPSTLDEDVVIVLDPMLATGSSLSKTLDSIKAKGAKHIRFLCLVAAPEGIKLIEKQHPDVDLYICAVDQKLNDQGYILPGLGDAGDRIFGTE